MSEAHSGELAGSMPRLPAEGLPEVTIATQPVLDLRVGF
jgi:hypothetical protein